MIMNRHTSPWVCLIMHLHVDASHGPLTAKLPCVCLTIHLHVNASHGPLIIAKLHHISPCTCLTWVSYSKAAVATHHASPCGCLTWASYTLIAKLHHTSPCKCPMWAYSIAAVAPHLPVLSAFCGCERGSHFCGCDKGS